MSPTELASTLAWRGFAELSPALLYELLRFRQAVFVVEQHCAYPDLDGRDEIADHLLLCLDRRLAGYLRLIPSAAEARIAIGRVAVAPAHRGGGLGRQMMEEALDRCRRDYSGWRVILGAQTYLVPFYESLGFRTTSAPYDDYGVSHVDMALADPKA